MIRWNQVTDVVQKVDPVVAASVATISVISFSLGVKVGRSQLPWKRLTSVHDIPATYFGPSSPWIRGRILSVSDGDTVRFLHVPTIFSSSRLDTTHEKISDNALPVRVCTIDTPETSKFGKSGQPKGEEAKEMLKQLVENKIVSIRMLSKDQYSRIVAEIRIPTMFPPFRKYVDEEMLKAGLAEVYEGSGAVYGRLRTKENYLSIADKAKKSKIGIWSLSNRESAKDFKARTKESP